MRLWVLGISFPHYDGKHEYSAIGPFSSLDLAESCLSYMASRQTIRKATIREEAAVPLRYRSLLEDLPEEQEA